MNYITVAVLALFEFWFAYPAAQAFQMDWVSASLLIAVSSSIGVLATIYICASFKEWVVKKIGNDGALAKRTGHFMAKYGTPGLGLMSPWILGPVLTSASAIALGANAKQLSIWAIAGIWLWAIVIYGFIVVADKLNWVLPF